MDNNRQRFKVENLSLWYGKTKALDDVNLPVHEHRITAFIGPSGCGKSTLLRCFNRMNDIIPGVRIEGRIDRDEGNIFDPSVDVYDLRMKVGMVFQKPNPFPKSILENTAFGLKVRGIKNKDVIMERVKTSLENSWLWEEVKDRLHAPAYSLSGGQQQRLCMARALATEPEILLLDEPTSALDPKSTNKIEELLVELKKRVTVVIVTHNMGQAGRISDYTAFMYLGQLIEFGRTENIFTAPQDKRTEDYLTGKFG